MKTGVVAENTWWILEGIWNAACKVGLERWFGRKKDKPTVELTKLQPPTVELTDLPDMAEFHKAASENRAATEKALDTFQKFQLQRLREQYSETKTALEEARAYIAPLREILYQLGRPAPTPELYASFESMHKKLEKKEITHTSTFHSSIIVSTVHTVELEVYRYTKGHHSLSPSDFLKDVTPIYPWLKMSVRQLERYCEDLEKKLPKIQKDVDNSAAKPSTPLN